MKRYKDGLGGAVRRGQQYKPRLPFSITRHGGRKQRKLEEFETKMMLAICKPSGWKSITRIQGVGTAWYIDGFGELVGSSYVFDTGDLT